MHQYEAHMIDMNESDDFRKWIAEMSPDMLDQSFRQSIQILWMSLPPSKRNAEFLKQAVRERYERILDTIENDLKMLEIDQPSPDEEPSDI